MLTLQGSITIHDRTGDVAVGRAAHDLARDLMWILHQPAHIVDRGDANNTRLVIETVPELTLPEAWRINVCGKGVTIQGADALGAIFGIYRFSQQCLGVDPMWFWKDQFPAPRLRVDLSTQTIESESTAFRYRGWFLNDEDLLSDWMLGGGRRGIDYPFYENVIHEDVLEAVLESILRSGCNLIIPASFLDVMNEPEARLVRQAVERGLYVSQHHVEPLGVSHFGFESYWRRRGEDASFAFGEDPDRVGATWKAYAQRWHELASRHVVWQLGLRGRGDKPVWQHDRSVSRREAGAFITRAMQRQREIIGEVDSRPAPPITTTLWAEGAQLLTAGDLVFPPDVTIIFSDTAAAQVFQEDFHTTPREPGRTYGVYYHPAVWSRGPHLVQGVTPELVREQMGWAIERGDTHYAIINTANVREHVIAIEAASQVMVHGLRFDADVFTRSWPPAPLLDAYEKLRSAAFDLGDRQVMQDGRAFSICYDLLRGLQNPEPPTLDSAMKLSPVAPTTLLKRARDAVALLDDVIDGFDPGALSPAQRPLATANLCVQAIILRAAYRCLIALAGAYSEPGQLADAQVAIEEAIDARQRAEQGHWRHWYRGDRKVDLVGLLQQITVARSIFERDA